MSPPLTSLTNIDGLPPPTANNDTSCDLDDDLLVLNHDQLRQIQLFRSDIRACQTDDEKHKICARIRDDLLDKHSGLEFLIAAYHHVMLAECADYEEWKTRDTDRSEHQTGRESDADDATQWERFVSVVQKGADSKARCLRALNTVRLFWGRHRVQHYEWGSKGAKYCEVLCSAAHAVHDWDEAAIKLCWIILQRFRRPGCREVRCSVNPIDQIDLTTLKQWSYKGPFTNPRCLDEGPLPFRALTATDLPDGFGFDQYLLIVRSPYSVSSAEPSTAGVTMFTSKSGSDTDTPNSTRSRADTGGVVSSPGSPVASPAESSVDRAMMVCVDAILEEQESDTTGSDHDSCGGLDDLREDVAQTRPPVNAARKRRATASPASAEKPQRELRSRTHNPEYRGPALTAASSSSRQTPAKRNRTKPANRPCCPTDVPSDFLSVLDKTSAFRVEVAEKYAPYLKKLCHKHLQRSAELAFAQRRDYSVQLVDHSSTGLFHAVGPAATITPLPDSLALASRRRAASEPDISQQLPTLGKQRFDVPDPLPTDPRDRPLHECIGDHAYLGRVRAELLEKLSRSHTGSNSHGEQNKLIYAILKGVLQPNTDKNQGKVEAYFCTPKEAASRLEAGFPDGPIFGHARQQFQWRDQDRPIVQLFRRLDDDLTRTVFVRIPSHSSADGPFEEQKLIHVQKRFLEQKVTDDPWVIPRLRSPLPPSVLPGFLMGENCQLLLRIRDTALAGATAAPEQWNEWRDVFDSVFLAEGGHNTAPQVHNLATWITVQEGRLGFAWMSRPTREQRDTWMADPHSSATGSWRYTVLKPGQTVAFDCGTVHFVFSLRGEQTLALRGHFLQWTGVSRWLQAVIYQMSYSGVAYKDVEWSAPNYVPIVESLVKMRHTSGRVKELGGEAVVAGFLYSLENFHRFQQSQEKK